jgi:hypothetical protein
VSRSTFTKCSPTSAPYHILALAGSAPNSNSARPLSPNVPDVRYRAFARAIRRTLVSPPQPAEPRLRRGAQVSVRQAPSRKTYQSGVPGGEEFGGTPLWNGGSARGVGRSGAPCESPQVGISVAAGQDSVLRRPAAGSLNLDKHRDPPRAGQRGGAGQFSAEASRPGGATPVLIRCGRILRTSDGSVMTASTFIGEPQRLQRRASTS